MKKKTRRSKEINNALRKLTIVYRNIRGLKSKVDSVQEIVADSQPNLLCLVETHMQEEEEIRIPGYETIYQNDKTSNSGGIVIAVKDTENDNHASKARNISKVDIMDTTK